MDTTPAEEEHRHGVNMENLEAILTAIDRANHLGIAIRQSPATGQQSKARSYQKRFDFSSFEEVAYLALRALYPDANHELIGQLARSMTETCALYQYRKVQQMKLGTSRQTLSARAALPAIVEEQGESSGTSRPPLDVALATGNPEGSTQLPIRTPRRPPVRQYEMPVASERPSSVDSQEVRRRYDKLLRPSTESKAKSILTRHAPYPKSPDGDSKCQWCFCPLDSSLLGDRNAQQWQYEPSSPPLLTQYPSRRCARLIHFIKETTSTTTCNPISASQRNAHSHPGSAVHSNGSSTCMTPTAGTGIASCTHRCHGYAPCASASLKMKKLRFLRRQSFPTTSTPPTAMQNLPIRR